MNLTSISFPGLGIDTFTLNKVAFSIGKISVRWYGIFITTGIVLAFLYAIWRGKRNENVKSDDILDVGILTVLLGVVGARVYYVLTTLNVHKYDSFYDVIAVWEGGIAIYGAIIGGILGIFIMCKIKKLKTLKLMDMIAPGVMIAQSIGRWGNFFNGEAYGYAIGNTSKYYFFAKEFEINTGEGTLFNTFRMGLGNGFYHPTFLYESVWNLLGFILINIFYRHKKYDGQITLMYLTWYGFGRMFIEGLRTDSLYLPGTEIRISQLIGLLCFAFGLILLLTKFFRRRRMKKIPSILDVEEAPRVYIRKMTKEERKTKTEQDLADAEAFLNERVEKVAENAGSEAEKPNEAGERG